MPTPVSLTGLQAPQSGLLLMHGMDRGWRKRA
jgi:hypothetical protein